MSEMRRAGDLLLSPSFEATWERLFGPGSFQRLVDHPAGNDFRKARERVKAGLPALEVPYAESPQYMQDHRESIRAGEAGIAAAMALKLGQHLEDCLVSSRVPQREIDALKSLKRTVATITIDNFMVSGATTLVLTGPTGAGKSVGLAYALKLNAVRGGIYILADDLVQLSDYGPESVLLRQCETTDLLCIDEIGAERKTERSEVRINGFITKRDSAKKQTIIASNLNATAFKEQYGARVWDRVSHNGVVVGLESESMRKRQ